MKKVLKKSLKELEKVMPTISESEQSSCVGGSYYYDSSGNYLGYKMFVGQQVDDQLDIRVCTDYAAEHFSQMSVQDVFSDTYSHSFSDTDVSSGLRVTIVNNEMARAGGFNTGCVSGNVNITGYTSDSSEWVTTIGGVITLNQMNPYVMLGNSEDIRCCVFFESKKQELMISQSLDEQTATEQAGDYVFEHYMGPYWSTSMEFLDALNNGTL